MSCNFIRLSKQYTVSQACRFAYDVYCVRDRPGSRVDQVDLGFPSRVKSVCSSVTVEIFWRRRFHYKSFQVDLRSRLDPKTLT